VRLLAILLIAMLAGCGPILTHGTPLAAVLAAEQQESGPYRLQPGDQVEVHHILDPDYSAVLIIAPDGTLNVPGIKQTVPARGKTVLELQADLDRLYQFNDVLSRPFFSVTLRAYGSLQVFVGGEVQRPGYLELSGGERRVLQVITSGGGFLQTARRSEVLILRTGANGAQTIFSVDLTKALSGEDLSQNVRVRPLDVVIVPKTDIASLDVWVDQYIRQALPLSTAASLTFTNNPALFGK
jgi:protein involved in polysaccharide export with SLBB domain